jgi:hypothetical protein
MANFKLVVETDPDDVTFYRVIKALVFDEDNDMIKDEAIYYISSSQIYAYIIGHLTDGSLIRIPKKLNSTLNISDIIINPRIYPIQENNNETLLQNNITKDELLYKYKRKYANMGREVIEGNNGIKKYSYMNHFYEFIKLTIFFMTMGILITEENRDEKYLEIINKISESNEEDSDMIIEKLEKYLDLITLLNEINDLHKSFDTYVDKINKISVPEDEFFKVIYNEWVVSIGKIEYIL